MIQQSIGGSKVDVGVFLVCMGGSWDKVERSKGGWGNLGLSLGMVCVCRPEFLPKFRKGGRGSDPSCRFLLTLPTDEWIQRRGK